MTGIWQLSNWAYRLVFSDKILSLASSFLILLSVCVSQILWIMINSFQLVCTSFVSFRQNDGDHRSGMASIIVRQPMAVVLRWRFVNVDMVSHMHQPIGSGEPLQLTDTLWICLATIGRQPVLIETGTWRHNGTDMQQPKSNDHYLVKYKAPSSTTQPPIIVSWWCNSRKTPKFCNFPRWATWAFCLGQGMPVFS